MLDGLVAMLTFENIMTTVITVGFAIGLVYLFFKKTGVEAKLKKIQGQKIEQTKTGWGAEEIKNLTELQIKTSMKLGEKINKKLIVGMLNLGKIKKRVKIKNGMWMCDVRNGFMSNLGIGKPVYLILNENEITHTDKKTIYTKDKIIFNELGIYYLVDSSNDTREKHNYINFLIDKMNYEDVIGRISNLATKVSYLDIGHAQNMEALNKRIEAILKERDGGNMSVMEMAAA